MFRLCVVCCDPCVAMFLVFTGKILDVCSPDLCDSSPTSYYVMKNEILTKPFRLSSRKSLVNSLGVLA